MGWADGWVFKGGRRLVWGEDSNGERIQMGRKENLPVWGKYDRLYGVV